MATLPAVHSLTEIRQARSHLKTNAQTLANRIRLLKVPAMMRSQHHHLEEMLTHPSLRAPQAEEDKALRRIDLTKRKARRILKIRAKQEQSVRELQADKEWELAKLARERKGKHVNHSLVKAQIMVRQRLEARNCGLEKPFLL